MLTQARLKAHLKYDRRTGLFHYRASRGKRAAGSVAGCTRPDGYVLIYIDGVRYYAHRLAHLYVTGKFPARLDHRDLNPSNNAWLNLRPATESENKRNRKVFRNNLLGVTGVYAFRNRFYARITLDKKTRCLGAFKTLELAIARRRQAELELFGEFARAA